MKRNRYATQGQCIVAALERKPHTYGDMLRLGLSTSPWRRVLEALKHRGDRRLIKGTNARGLVTWRVVRG